MSTTKRLKTAGLNEDGTSRLSVTKKKKSKSRYIIPAVIGTAALLSGFGGFGASSGESFFSSIGKFFGFHFFFFSFYWCLAVRLMLL